MEHNYITGQADKYIINFRLVMFFCLYSRISLKRTYATQIFCITYIKSLARFDFHGSSFSTNKLY